MTKKIFKSVFFSTLVILAASLALILGALNRYFMSLEETQLTSQAQLAAAGVETSGMDYLNSLPSSDEYRITWIAADGTVQFDNQADVSTLENHLNREEVQQALINGEGKAVRYSSTMAKRTMYHAVLLADHTILRVSVTTDTVGLMVLRLTTTLLWILIGAIVLSWFMSKWLSRRIVEPLNHLDLDHPLENQGYEEIAPLLTRIDRQNDQISDQLNQLHQKQKEFETVTSSIHEGLIVLNHQDEILSVNPAALRLFEADSSVNGKHILTLCRDEKISRILEEVHAGRQAEDILTVKDRTIRIAAAPITSKGTYTGASFLASDISEEYAAEQQRREFTANVSHELKTPLQSIMGSAELLENHLVKPEDEAQFVHRIRTESARLLTLIDDIIRLSQLDENSVAEEEIVNVSDLVREAQESLQKSAEEHHATIQTDLKETKIKANARLIYEIAYNLMDNAIRYNKENGTVTVSTYSEADRRYLKVRDTGIGIPADSLNRIFERFYRVDKSHSRATGGTGLGLSIVKHAVSISHGTIQVSSRINEGSEFLVTFPAAEQK